MRVITGVAKGHKLITLDGLDVRPTTDRVKEGLFSAIQFDLPCAKVLDLFSGSGQLGIEALSRGAQFCDFVDESKKAVDITTQNLKNTKLTMQSRIVCQNAFEFIEKTEELFDIVFLDPPYNSGIIKRIMPMVTLKISGDATIICEHENDEKLEKEISGFICTKQYHYGKICVSIFRKK